MSAAPNLVLAPSRVTRRLDLGCGQSPREGFEGVDIAGGKAVHVVDLFKFPWPFEDESVLEIHASHFLEHVQAREVEVRDMADPFVGRDAQKKFDERFLGQDMLFACMDECHRILVPDGWMTAIVPFGRSSRAFQDPTHRRFLMQETFSYFSAEWRKSQALDHYRVRCNFAIEPAYSTEQEESLRHAEAHAMRLKHYWNVALDLHVKLKKLPCVSSL